MAAAIKDWPKLVQNVYEYVLTVSMAPSVVFWPPPISQVFP